MKTVKWILGVLLVGELIFSLQAQESKEVEKFREYALEEALRDTNLVSLTKKDNVYIKDAIEQLAKKGGVNIVLDERNITDKDTINIPELKSVPFKEALEAIMQIGGLMIDDETPAIIKISKPPTLSIDLE